MIKCDKKFACFLILLTISALPLSTVSADQGELFVFLERMETSYARVADYTALFHRRERIDGEWRSEEVSVLKFQRPFKVYMRWLSSLSEGREAIYVEGANKNKVVIHEPRGLSSFFTFLLDPGGWRILENSRFPFTEIGIGRLIERIGRDARRAWAKKELRLMDRGRTRIMGREVREIEGVLPREQKAGYGSYRMVVGVDEEHGLPIQASIYDWDNVIVGEYSYRDLRLNPGLTEADFDPSNPGYQFARWRISLSDGE